MNFEKSVDKKYTKMFWLMLILIMLKMTQFILPVLMIKINLLITTIVIKIMKIITIHNKNILSHE